MGAVPEDRYRAVVDWFLDGEPGGLLPLAEDQPARVTRPGSE